MRGDWRPLFYYPVMIDQEKLEALVREAVSLENAFLVDLQHDAGDKIRVEVDRPGGISLSSLTNISRHIEGALDRDENDFSLEVASPGVGTPFKVLEQYAANVGRPVKVLLMDGLELTGDIIRANDKQIVISWKELVPKEKGKGKHSVVTERSIDIKDIKQTKLEVRF